MCDNQMYDVGYVVYNDVMTESDRIALDQSEARAAAPIPGLPAGGTLLGMMPPIPEA